MIRSVPAVQFTEQEADRSIGKRYGDDGDLAGCR